MSPTIPAVESWFTGEPSAQGDRLRVLADRVVLPYLSRQRWFPAKGRSVATLSLVEAIRLPAGEGVLFIVHLEYVDSGQHRFALPVAYATGDVEARVRRDAPDRVIAEVRDPGGILHDDLTLGLGQSLLLSIAGGLTWPATAGTIAGTRTPAFDQIAGGLDVGTCEVRAIAGEQSNTSIILGDQVILKLIRRLEAGLNPDYEIGRHLGERVPFAGVPALAGAVLWRDAVAEPTVLAVAQAYVPGAVPLRERVVTAIAAFMRRHLPSLESHRTWTATPGACAELFDAAAALGRKTGALHLALADAHGDPAFEPAPANAGDLGAIARDMRAQLDLAFAALSARAQALPPSAAALASRVLESKGLFMSAVDAVARVSPGLARIRVHGDYQLDQVLCAGGDFVIIDFEGEPLRPLTERRAKFLALKDVAGMARSYSYAAYAALFDVAGDDEGMADRLEPLARWWQRAATDAFVSGYREVAGCAPFVPASPRDFDTVLSAFLVEKATYELRYEIGHRPRWLRIPLRGMADLLDRLGH
jgi:trehalose synthase-fused probable maltokinase